MLMSDKYLKSIYNSGWRIVIILTVLLQASIIPLDFLFNLRSLNWYRTLDLSISLIFCLDLIVNILRYREVKTHSILKDVYWDSYSSQKFFVADILSLLPYAVIFSHPAFQLLRLFKWVRVYRTARFFQIRNIRMSAKISLWFMLLGF